MLFFKLKAAGSPNIQQLAIFFFLSWLGNSALAASFPAEFEPRRMGPEVVRMIGGSENIDQVGTSLGALGDIDGDGYADFAIGTQSQGWVSEGYMIFGSASNEPIDLDPNTIESNGGIALNDAFAVRIAGISTVTGCKIGFFVETTIVFL